MGLHATLSQCLTKLAAIEESAGQMLANDQSSLAYFKHAMHLLDGLHHWLAYLIKEHAEAVPSIKLGSDRSRGLPRARGPVKVLFILHFAQNWPVLRPIYLRMLDADDFLPFIATVEHDLSGRSPVEAEAEFHAQLETEGIPHLRWKNAPADQNLLRYFAPDIVFRQTPWEKSIPQSLRTNVSGFTRLAYVPYTLDLTEDDSATINQELHHAAWRIFCASDRHVSYFRQRSLIGGMNAVAVGHLGMDALSLEAEHCRAKWPFEATTRRYRIIWAPHHSLGGDWLRFGTFHQVWRAVLEFARLHEEEVELVLRPHHLLFSMAVSSGMMTADEIELFLEQWRLQRNTHLDHAADYLPLFAASDLLLTDGISFLGEYQATGKPVVFLEREDHSPFNPVGQRIVEGTYRETHISDALARAIDLMRGGTDGLADMRAAVTAELVLQPGRTADLVLDQIRLGLAEEANG